MQCVAYRKVVTVQVLVMGDMTICNEVMNK